MTDPKTTTSYELFNPLDAFSTYSTHFVILAARTTENARLFTEVERNVETLAAIDATPALGDKVNYPGAKGDVFLVIDTRRFSQYTVENMKYEVLINGLSKGQSHANLATLVEMTVLDSVGISFINYMQWLMDSKMQTNFDGMIFLIRVIFVGHLEDGTSQTVQDITIPAHLFKMEVNLDYAKGIYNLEFMPNTNFSISEHRRWLNIGTASSYFTGDGNKTLGGLIDSFEVRLNEESSKNYNALQPLLKQAGRPPAQTTGKFGRLVKYQITVPEDWRKFTFTGASVNAAEERNFVDELKKQESAKTEQQKKQSSPSDGTSAPTKDAHMSVNAGILITDVLDLIFKQVKEIAQFANSEKVSDTDKYLTFYKHVIGITSDEETVTLHVDVVPFEVPNIKPPSQKDTASSVSQHQDKFYVEVTDAATKTKKRIPKNYFELDYIFTGKNTHILNFDMKIQDLQFMLASNTKVSEGELVSQVLEGQGDKQKAEAQAKLSPRIKEVLSARQYDPLLIPTLTKEELASFSAFTNFRNKEEQRETTAYVQQYSRNLSAFYAISPVQISMTIKGNPLIMGKFNLPEFPPNISTTTNTGAEGGQTTATSQTAKQEYRQKFEERVLKKKNGVVRGNTPGTFSVNPPIGNDSYVSTPVFVKVNIKGPNVDFLDNGQIVTLDDAGKNLAPFATEVLYDNYYVVFKVVNKIERGIFTQELELWSHNVYGQGKLTSEQIQTKQPNKAPATTG